ncbi:MAG: DUF4402 domain-containing protein [Gammaproteobacteria bacterium]|jgi:hypothetical protein
MKFNTHLYSSLLAAHLLILTETSAAPAPGGLPNINQCNNKNSLSAVLVQDLSFGDFDGSLAGTIAVDTNGNIVSPSPPDHAGGIVSAAAFDVSNSRSGCDFYPVQILLPATATLAGPATMSASSFVSDPVNQFTLSPTPGQATRVYVGATLTSGINQTAGAYTGPFDVIFEHVNP